MGGVVSATKNVGNKVVGSLSGSILGKVGGGLIGGDIGKTLTGSPDLMTGVNKSKLDKLPFSQELARRGTQEEYRKGQVRQTQRLEDQATGKSPSIAEAELKAATDRSLAQQLAAAKTGRGGSAAARERQLAKSQAEARRDLSQQSVIAKLKERQLAESQLGQQLLSQRGQDIGLAQADREALQAYENLKVQQDLAMAGMQLSANKQASAEQGDWLKRTVGISDKRSKQKIKKEGSGKNLAKGISDENSKKNKKPINVNKYVDEGTKNENKRNTSVAEVVATVLTAGGASAAGSAAKEVGKTAAKEAGKVAAKEAGKTALKEAGKEAAKEAGKTVAKEAGKTVAKKSMFSRLGDHLKESAKETISDFKSGKTAKDYLKNELESSIKRDTPRGDDEGLKQARLARSRMGQVSDEDSKKSIKLEQEPEESKKPLKIEELVKSGSKSESPMGALGKAFKYFEENESGVQLDNTGDDQFKKSRDKIQGRSDKRCKENIKESDDSFNPRSFLDALQAYSYEYKDKFKNDDMAGPGRRLGILAQDLEKAGPVGRSMVKEGPDGKYVDYGQGFGAILAAQAHLNQRLSELEKKKK